MQRYVVGIDAGATKTEYVLFDRQTERLILHRGGPANHEVLSDGFNTLRVLLKEELTSLCSAANISIEQIGSIGAGMAGVDTPEQHRIISDIFRDLGICKLALANDAILGIKANCPDGAGVCAVNGTGFSVIAADQNDAWFQVGGQGYLTGDAGGGGYLLYCVSAAVYDALLRNGPSTALTKPFLQYIGCDGPGDYAQAIANATQDPSDPCIFTSVLINRLAQEGDPVAKGILEHIGLTYARSILAAVSQLPSLKSSPIPVVLVGSNFVRFPDGYTIQVLREALQKAEDCEFAIEMVHASPSYGAVLWACAASGSPASACEANLIRSKLEHACREASK